MTASILSLTPFIPSDQALAQSGLPDKAMAVMMQSAKLTGSLSPLTFATLSRHMRVINSYYSNLIEGNPTKPYEIRAAYLGDFDRDPAKRNLQQEVIRTYSSPRGDR